MNSFTIRPRPVHVRSRWFMALVIVAGVLATAFVVAPAWLASIGPGDSYSDRRHLAEAARAGFVVYWRSGDRAFPPELAGAVDYWFRYHVAKAVIAVLLLMALLALGRLLWKTTAAQRGSRVAGRAANAAAGLAITTLALSALVLVMANIQGAMAPFASLLPMVTEDSTDAELTKTLDQVRYQVANFRTDRGETPAALDLTISDFSRYHMALAVTAAIVAIAFVGLAALLWRRLATTAQLDRRSRRIRTSAGIFLSLLALALFVVSGANLNTATDPSPALLTFFQGGW